MTTTPPPGHAHGLQRGPAHDPVPAPSALRRLVIGSPVAAFLLIALPVSLAVMSVPAMAAYDVIPGKHLPQNVGLSLEEAASLLLVVVMFTTVLVVTRLVDGPDGVRVLLRRVTRWRVPLRWWLLAVGAMPLGTVTLAVVLGDEPHLPSIGTLGAELGALLVALFLANLGEEAAWTGFVQTRLERRHNFLLAALVTAVPFGIVHLPLRVITGESTTTSGLLTSFIVLVVFGFFLRTLVATLARGAANSVLLAAVTHTFFNRSNNSDGLAADILTGPNQQSAATLTTVFLAVALVVANRRRLTKAYRHQLDAAEVSALTAARATTAHTAPAAPSPSTTTGQSAR